MPKKNREKSGTGIYHIMLRGISYVTINRAKSGVPIIRYGTSFEVNS